MVYILLSNIISVLVSIPMAKKRNRNILVWVVFSLFIGWFAPLLLLLMGDNDEEEVDEDQANEKNSISIKKENEYIDLLLKYKKLLDEGIITNNEFEEKKKQIMKKETINNEIEDSENSNHIDVYENDKDENDNIEY